MLSVEERKRSRGADRRRSDLHTAAPIGQASNDHPLSSRWISTIGGKSNDHTCAQVPINVGDNVPDMLLPGIIMPLYDSTAHTF